MLVKTIQRDTELDIAVGPDVVLRVRWHRGQIKLGIDAPRDLKITSNAADSGEITTLESAPLMRKP